VFAGIREDLKLWVSNLKAGDSDTWFMTIITVFNIGIIHYVITAPF
jgi:hypothetical protein